MIAPDTGQVDLALSRAAAVGESVSFYAGVIGHIVPVLLAGVTDHDLSDAQAKALQQAIRTGQDWTAIVCETLAQDLVPLVSGFHGQFLQKIDAIRSIRCEITRSGAGATPQHRQRAIDLFQGLQTLVEDMEDRIRRGNGKVIRLIAAAALDRAALEALSNYPPGPALSAEDVLTRTVGFCKLPIALRPEVEHALTPTAASQVYALALSASASAGLGNDKTVAEMGQLRGIWGYAAGLLRAQIEDLTEGPTRDVARIIDRAQLDEACAAWATMIATVRERCPPQSFVGPPGASGLRLATSDGRALP